MTAGATVRALADLSELDVRLSAGNGLTDRAARAIESRRAALRDAIPGNFLAAYDALGREGRRPAVVPLVRDAHCGGCYMRVPPQLTSFVRRRQAVCSCPHCRRLLFFSAEVKPADGKGKDREEANEGTTAKRGKRRPGPERRTARQG